MTGGGAGGGGGKGAAAAGPIPAASRKLVQSLKEIVNRPDAEIYAALRDCGMDPDEAVSRLLSQDTFQEVKSKRDKKKEVKEIPEPRSRAASSAASRGIRGGADRGGRNSSFHSSSIDNVASRSISGPGVTPTNSTQKQTVPSSSVNRSVVADGPSVPPQSSSGFQHGWSGTPGQLSMADIVKMGRPQPQVKQSSSKPAVTADKGYAGQYPSLPSTVNQNLKQSASTVSATNHDQGLHSAQDSIHFNDHNHSAAVNKQAYDNDWLPQDVPPSGYQSALPETSGDQSFYESSTQVAGVINSHENSHSDENNSAAIASERHLEHHGGNSEYDNELLQDSSYLPQKNSLAEDEVEDSNADVALAAENFQGLNLHNEELAATKLGEDNPAVIIPDHLQVTGSDCVTLSFGSFESGAFSGLLPVPSRSADDNNVELPAIEESVHLDQIDSRDQDYYDSAAVNSSGNENLGNMIGSNMENLDVPSVSQPADVLRQEVLDHPGLQYNLPSDSSAAYANTTQPSTMESSQGNNQEHTLSHLTNLLQANSLHNSLLGSNMPLRDLDFSLSPLLAAQSMAPKYNSAAPTTTGPAISMQEALKPGVFSNTQSTQNLPSTSIQTGPLLPQQLVHPYSQPTVPLAPFTNMIGYPYLAQNYPAAYLPSAAFQQAYSSNGPFHQSAAAAVPAAAMKYNMNVPQQYKSNLSATSLQQQPSSVISGYGGFGSSSNLQGNFALNQNAATASTNLGFDEALSTQYKDPSQYMALQQGDNSAMWLHGAGSRATSTLPPNHFYGFQGQSQQGGGFRQAQQPQQHNQFGGHGYPAFYHSQGGLTQEHHQNPAEGGLNGFQTAQSQPSHQGWQQHTGY
uniref:GBF-interacting protein 1 N-terminal domain-containing protein n=1 Tax=Leersia perrieri TaxID=77586 RepID=A0A0D9WJU4_9ORYZ